MNEALGIRSLKDRVSPEEWAVRVDLAACYRLVARFGWEDLAASSRVRIDIEGNDLQGSPYPVNRAGFVIHSAIHAARGDARCVLHTHTVNGIAVAAQAAGLLPISQHALSVRPSLGYHDYEGVSLHDDEKPRLVGDLGSATHLILRNHGLLTVGETVADAFVSMYYLETSCAIQVRAQAGGGELAWPGLLRRLDRIDPSFRE